jgi:hypothetical protein
MKCADDYLALHADYEATQQMRKTNEVYKPHGLLKIGT